MECLRENLRVGRGRALRFRSVNIRERHDFVLGSLRKRCVGIVELHKYLVSSKMTPREGRATCNVNALRHQGCYFGAEKTSGRVLGYVTLVDANFFNLSTKRVSNSSAGR